MAIFDPIIPLRSAHSPPPFPLECLPAVIRNYVEFVAKSVQVYPDMPASVALSVLSLCLQGKTRIEINPTWHEEINLYMMVAAPPAERKSPVFHAMTAPVNDYVNEYNGEHLIDFQTYRNSKKVLDSKLNKAIDKGEGNDILREIQLEINALQPVTEKKLITTDVTAEALASIMEGNNEVMGIMSDEGGVFDVISGMYSGNLTNLNIFLQSYNGEPVRIDRKCGSVSLRRPLLTFGICTQPDVLGTVISNPRFMGRGLVQRFLFCLPESMLGMRGEITNTDSSTVGAAYRNLIYRLLNIPVDFTKRTFLSAEARSALFHYMEQVEFQMSGNEILSDYKDYFGKHIGKTIRIAALMHLCENSPDTPVSGQTMNNAIRIATYYGQHYLKMICADKYDITPHFMLSKLIAKAKKDHCTEISLRNIKRAARSLTEEQITDALDVLTEHNYLVCIPVPPGSGSRKKESYAINPLVLEDNPPSHCPDLSDFDLSFNNI